MVQSKQRMRSASIWNSRFVALMLILSGCLSPASSGPTPSTASRFRVDVLPGDFGYSLQRFPKITTRFQVTENGHYFPGALNTQNVRVLEDGIEIIERTLAGPERLPANITIVFDGVESSTTLNAVSQSLAQVLELRTDKDIWQICATSRSFMKNDFAPCLASIRMPAADINAGVNMLIDSTYPAQGICVNELVEGIMQHYPKGSEATANLLIVFTTAQGVTRCAGRAYLENVSDRMATISVSLIVAAMDEQSVPVLDAAISETLVPVPDESIPEHSTPVPTESVYPALKARMMDQLIMCGAGACVSACQPGQNDPYSGCKLHQSIVDAWPVFYQVSYDSRMFHDNRMHTTTLVLNIDVNGRIEEARTSLNTDLADAVYDRSTLPGWIVILDVTLVGIIFYVVVFLPIMGQRRRSLHNS